MAAPLSALLQEADEQLKAMVLLALNCGFGPKDIHDLTWDHIQGNRVTLPRSKTGISQTFMLWPETKQVLDEIRSHRQQSMAKGREPGPETPPDKHVFVTMFGKTWSKDSLAEQFRELCKKAGVPCHGFYRLRHCASTAVSLVASPHVQRKFMRHSQIQQQVAYTHMPDAEVDAAVMKTRGGTAGQDVDQWYLYSGSRG
jgi:integrase